MERTDDAVEWRPDLMRHVRQELQLQALVLRSPLRLLLQRVVPLQVEQHHPAALLQLADLTHIELTEIAGPPCNDELGANRSIRVKLIAFIIWLICKLV